MWKNKYKLLFFSYEGTDGTIISSEGGLKSLDNDKTGESVVGSVHYKVRFFFVNFVSNKKIQSAS